MNSTDTQYNLVLFNYDSEDKEQKNFLDDFLSNEKALEPVTNIGSKIKDKNQFKTLLAKDVVLNQYIGICLVRKYDYDPSIVSLESVVDLKYRNKKYGTTMLKKVIELIFSDKSIIKILVQIDCSNEKSRRMTINNGFIFDEEAWYKGNDFTHKDYYLENPNVKG